ncbi:hypothetical protein ALP05_101419 [Pseudomonas caricapapayae]|uniref:Uncharacterized protein n=1 Tax=Pseudomonas caricapapayae TaxID=46678 RepID=A0A3M6FCY0_9PSED|nr:hypothetical protein F4W67_25220 [Pseudomonas caricapapayae]RMV77774.1 hypothetical protein ALP05_101419 [Pseudomonas caricapapayae]RMV97781.1 hypothetical protein ALP01_100977 [Pseudomonas caricapapayae]
MKFRDAQSYDALAQTIWKAAQALLGISLVAQRQWYEQTFCLAALGDSLAIARKWDLSGMEAIEYALILRHSWLPDQIRQMTPRDKWLSLHEELAGLEMAYGAKQALRGREARAPFAIDSPEDVWRVHPWGCPVP